MSDPTNTQNIRSLTILADIRAATTAMRHAKAALAAAQNTRLTLYLAGRQLDPPLTFADMAEAAEVTESAVIQAVRKVVK